MRKSQSGVNHQDVMALKSALSDPCVRNLYCLGHGGSDGFTGLTFADLVSATHKRRLRFFFIDACDSAKHNFLLAALGVDPNEYNYPDFRDWNFYDPNGPSNTRKIRPGAFLGWTVEPPFAYPLASTVLDPTTQKPCNYRVFETLCNWHGVLVANWTIGYTLQSSIDQANSLATTWIGYTPLGSHDWGKKKGSVNEIVMFP